MVAIASENPRVTRPCLHLAIYPPPSSRLSPEDLCHVVVNVLSEVGLGDHQALLVIHELEGDLHAHAVVNRVHPMTGRAWARDFDYHLVNVALDRESRRLGLPCVDRHGSVGEGSR